MVAQRHRLLAGATAAAALISSAVAVLCTIALWAGTPSTRMLRPVPSLAVLAVQMSFGTGGLLPFFYLSPGAVALGFALSLAVGLIAGFLPALSAGRLRVVDALRRV